MELQLTRSALVVTVLSFFVTVGASLTSAASLTLNDVQLREAVELGQSKFDQDQMAFRWDYIKNLGYGYPQVLLRTEYLAVADYVRRSEYQRKFGSQRIHELTDERIERARREVDGRLQFFVTVYGPTEDFMKDYNFGLMVSDEQLIPETVDMPVLAEHSGFQGKLTFSATIIIDFPTDYLKGNEIVTLIIDPPNGLGPSGSRDSNFEVPFDLSAVK